LTSRRVILDTSVLVATIDARDAQHGRALHLVRALESRQLDLLVLDCVAVETVGVLCRRREERRRAQRLPSLAALFANEVTRAYPLLETSWAELLSRVEESDGRLNLHDALILAYAGAYGIAGVASFDEDFKHQPGVACLATPENVAAF
jgi:predicted nucleic acid-binding protein